MVVFGTSIALALTAAIVATTDVAWILPRVAFLVWGPICAVICDVISSHNRLGGASGRLVWLPATATLAGLSMASALLTSFLFDAGFWKSLGYSSVLVAFTLAMNAIVIEIEDNAPGGWLHPDTRNKNN
jgi:hypothetical protein